LNRQKYCCQYAYVGGNPASQIDPLGLCSGLPSYSAAEAQGLAIQQLWKFLTTPSSWGISFEVSTINPFTSGGGGEYGLNFQYTDAEG
jgi:hypothetical protein